MHPGRHARENVERRHPHRQQAVVADEGAELRAQALRLRSEYALRFVARSTRSTRAKVV